MARYAVKMPQEIYFVAHQDYDNWSPARFSPADIKYYHHDLVERLEAEKADLLAACQIAFDAINLNDETKTAREVLAAVIAEATQP